MPHVATNLDAIARSVREQLADEGLKQELKDIKKQYGNLSMQALEQAGVIGRLVAAVQAKRLEDEAAPQQSAVASQPERGTASGVEQTRAAPRADDVNEPSVMLFIRGARGFTSFLGRAPRRGEVVWIEGQLFGHTFRTPPVGASVDPDIDFVATVPMPCAPREALDVTEKLHLVAVATFGVEDSEYTCSLHDALDGSKSRAAGATHSAAAAKQPAAGERDLLGTAFVDWQPVLCSHAGKGLTATVELRAPTGLTTGPTVVAGVVDVRLQLVPAPRRPIDKSLLTRTQRAVMERDTCAVTAFHGRARAWWSDYTAQNQDYKNAQVKLILTGEDGVQRPATAYVKALTMQPSVPTPHHALRLVSLLQDRDDPLDCPGASVGSVVCFYQTVLCAMAATPLERSLLLCGLLLGLGLDAYVSVGGDRSWVTSIDHACQPTFWDPASGRMFSEKDGGELAGCPFLGPSCLFNNSAIHATLQNKSPDDVASFDLHDRACWKTMEVSDEEVPSGVPCGSEAHTAGASLTVDAVESEVWNMIAEHRKREGLPPVVHDKQLGRVLSSGLVAYEHEALWGVAAPGSAFFQDAVRRMVPDGLCFTATPMNLASAEPCAVLTALLAHPAASSMLSNPSPGTRMAIRMRQDTYGPVTSVWVLLASISATQNKARKVRKKA
ncbi:unnamed protein product [Pedinophyceae sp. YPF-701]|nr:unnamed protein product [Pedinophyceae sp. YPF-701]